MQCATTTGDHDTTRQSKPVIVGLLIPRNLDGDPQDAKDHVETNGAATDAGGQPRRKKQRLHYKPPHVETMARSSDESIVPTHYGAGVHGSGSATESRIIHRSDISSTTIPSQMQFILSPRQRSTNDIVPEPGGRRLPRSDIFHQRHPIEYQATSTPSSPLRHVASLPTGSSRPCYNVTSPEALDYQLHSDSDALLPISKGEQQPRELHTSGTFRSLIGGSIPCSANIFGFQDMQLAVPQNTMFSNSINSLSHGSPTQYRLYHTANSILDDMRCSQQQPRPQDRVSDALMTPRNGGNASMEQPRPSVSVVGRTFPIRLPVTLSQSMDILNLNAHQVYLRKQIELFEATQDDLYACARGRNKRIHVGQVGIRCRHCAHIPARMRQAGTVYFPATTGGLYQAAQNMSTNHIQCGLCTEMPERVKDKFVELWPTKNTVSRVGRKYWEETARSLGIVDTEDGMAFLPYCGTGL